MILPPVVGAQHFLPPWLLTSAGDRIATTASKPRHDRKRWLFRQLTSVVHATLGYSRWGSLDSMPYTLFLNEGLEPEFLFLSVAISLKNCGSDFKPQFNQSLWSWKSCFRRIAAMTSSSSSILRLPWFTEHHCSVTTAPAQRRPRTSSCDTQDAAEDREHHTIVTTRRPRLLGVNSSGRFIHPISTFCRPVSRGSSWENSSRVNDDETDPSQSGLYSYKNGEKRSVSSAIFYWSVGQTFWILQLARQDLRRPPGTSQFPALIESFLLRTQSSRYGSILVFLHKDFFSVHLNLCRGYSLGSSRWDDSNEYLQHRI